MKIKSKRLSDTAKLPTYGSKKAACADIYCDLRVDKCCELNPNADYKHMEVNTDYFEQLYIAPHETVKSPQDGHSNQNRAICYSYYSGLD